MLTKVNGFTRRTRKFKEELFLLYFAMKHPQTPLYAKAGIVISFLYLLSPVDLIPDFIPFVGYLDDLVIVPFLLQLSVRLLPATVKEAAIIKAKQQNRTLNIALVITALLVVLLMAGLFFLTRNIIHYITS